MKAHRNGMMPMSDQQIRDRAWSLEAAGHPTAGGRPQAGAPKTVMQCLMVETGLSREVLHRILRKDRTRGGKRRQAPSVGKAKVGPSVNHFMGQMVAKNAEQTIVGIKPKETHAEQTITLLQQSLLDAERRNEALRLDLEMATNRSDSYPMNSRAEKPLAPTPLDPLSELVIFSEIVPFILAWKDLPPRLRLVLQHYEVEVRRLL